MTKSLLALLLSDPISTTKDEASGCHDSADHRTLALPTDIGVLHSHVN